MPSVQTERLPDLFTFDDGKSVRTADDWQRRRNEILDHVLAVEYGHLPPAPKSVHGEELHRHNVARLMNARHTTWRIVIEDGARTFWFGLVTLVPEGNGPFPVVVNGDDCWKNVTDEVILEVLRRGYALATFNRTEIVPDNYSSSRDTGLYLVHPGGDYGALAAWAWGYHRIVDFLCSQSYVDASKIAVVGHSRGGKSVLLAGATDERIALTAPNNSGCGGAGCFLVQGEGSETIADILKPAPYWFSPRFRDFIGRERELPLDQHFVKALVAPRSYLSTEALGDLWANPRGTLQTHLAAREAYRLLGAADRIGIWFREGEHMHGIEDWKAFLDFADLQFRGTKSGRSFAMDPFPDMPRVFSAAPC